MEKTKKRNKFLFNLIVLYFKKELDNVVKNGIKIQFIGKINQLPSKLKKVLIETSEKTKNNKKIKVNLAINYGSKKELIDAFKKIKNNKNINVNKHNLYTKNEPDPEYFNQNRWPKKD